MGKKKRLFNNKGTGIDEAVGSEKARTNPIARLLKRKQPVTEENHSAAYAGREVGGYDGRKSKRTPITIDVDTAPPKRGRSSILIAETKAMERNRRLAEQQGERKLASVKAREHSPESEVQPSPEGELQNSILQHPELDSQRFDGVDPNLNPEPPLNTEARREYDNERREQDKEKQLRLGNMPKFSTAPTPHGPS